jgi:hypothetical protein
MAFAILAAVFGSPADTSIVMFGRLDTAVTLTIDVSWVTVSPYLLATGVSTFALVTWGAYPGVSEIAAIVPS